MSSRVSTYVLVGVLASVVVAVGFASTAQADIIAQYKFEQGANFLTDSSGHGHNLVQGSDVAVMHAVWAAGPGGIDTAFFNAYASLATATALDLSSYRRLRVSWSMNNGNWLDTGNEVVFEHGWGAGGGAGIGAFVNSSALGVGSAGIVDYPTGQYVVDSYTHPTYGSTGWADFAVEINLDGSTRADELKVFKNGVDVGGTVFSGALPPAFSAVAKFSLGAYAGAVLGNGDVYYGNIANMTISGEVPEPGTIVLLTTGLVGLLAYAWRKRK